MKISGDSGTRAEAESLITIYIVECELACFAYLCHHPLNGLKLLTRALFSGPCQCSYIFVSLCVFSRSFCRRPESQNIIRSRHSLE